MEAPSERHSALERDIQDLKIEINTGDEIEEMSRALNISVDGLNNKSLSAINIG